MKCLNGSQLRNMVARKLGFNPHQLSVTNQIGYRKALFIYIKSPKICRSHVFNVLREEMPSKSFRVVVNYDKNLFPEAIVDEINKEAVDYFSKLMKGKPVDYERINTNLFSQWAMRKAINMNCAPDYIEEMVDPYVLELRIKNILGR